MLGRVSQQDREPDLDQVVYDRDLDVSFPRWPIAYTQAKMSSRNGPRSLTAEMLL